MFQSGTLTFKSGTFFVFFVSKDKKKFFDKTRNLGIGLNIEFPNQPGTLTFQSGMKSNPLYCWCATGAIADVT